MASKSTTSLHSIPAVRVPPPSPPQSPKPASTSSDSVYFPHVEPTDDEAHTSISSHLTKSHRRRLNPFHTHKVTKTLLVDEQSIDHLSSLASTSTANPTQLTATPPLTPESSDDARNQQPLASSSTSASPLPKSDHTSTAASDSHHQPVVYTLDDISEPPWSPPQPFSRADSAQSSGGIKLSVAVRRAGTVIRHGHPDGSDRKALKVERKQREAGRQSIELEEETEEGGTKGLARGSNDRHDMGTLGRLGNKMGVPGTRKGYKSGGSLREKMGRSSHTGEVTSSGTLEREHSIPEAGPSSHQTLSANYAPSSYTTFTAPGSPLQRLTSTEPLISPSNNNSSSTNNKLSDNFLLPPSVSSTLDSTTTSQANSGSVTPSTTFEIPLPSRLPPSQASTPATRPSTPTGRPSHPSAEGSAEGANVDPEVHAADRMESLEERIDLELIKSKRELSMGVGKRKGREKGNRRSGDLAVDDGTVVWERLWQNQRGILFFGTPRYSSSSLLPSDPSAYSRPGLTKLACRTIFTPDSFQLPDGTWSWASEWMVNMRRDGETDEKGWEYNSYFHKKGWKSCLPWHGWKGWVRRREWIRLRVHPPPPKYITKAMLLPPPEPSAIPSIQPSPMNPVSTSGARDGKGKLPHSPKQMLDMLGCCKLDRERIEVWESWLKLDDAREHKIEEEEQEGKAEGEEENGGLRDLVERNYPAILHTFTHPHAKATLSVLLSSQRPYWDISGEIGSQREEEVRRIGEENEEGRQERRGGKGKRRGQSGDLVKDRKSGEQVGTIA